MGLFDAFKKKDCEICGKEVGMFGYKKLEDGEICKDCVKLLSPWFDDRRHSTVEQIQAQLKYREENRAQLKEVHPSKTFGERAMIYVEYENGIPSRFAVTRYGDLLEENADLIRFRDVLSFRTNIEEDREELQRENADGEMVSYNPPRYKYSYDFYITIHVRNPYFDDIKFLVNRGVVTLETIGGFGAGVASSFLRGAGVGNARFSTGSFRDAQEQRKFNEYQQMCQIIEQAVEDGKRGAAAPAAQSAGAEPLLKMIEQMKSAPDLGTVFSLQSQIAHQATNLPEFDWLRIKAMTEAAVEAAKQRIIAQETGSSPVQEAPKPKFCPNCGAPYEGGKFCQSCGSKL